MRRACRQVGTQNTCVVRLPTNRTPRCASDSSQAVSTPSRPRIARLASGPPALYSPRPPSERSTRWQGISSGIGLWPSAVPTARTARGRPISRATQPYVRTSPRGISSVLSRTSRSNGLRAARSKRRRRPRPASASVSWTASRSGRAARATDRPNRRANHRSKSSPPPAQRSADTPSPLHATCAGRTGVSTRANQSVAPGRTPAAARTRSTNPSGAWTRPRSRRSFSSRSTSAHLAQPARPPPQRLQPTVHVGLDRALWLPQQRRHLGVRHALDTAQHDRRALVLGQAADQVGELAQAGAAQRPALRARRRVGDQRLRLQGHQPQGPPADAVAEDVERDLVQPRAQAQGPEPLRRIAAEGG